jgi:hypothetical protein
MSIASNPQALTLAQFWRWLKLHYNCILRAGDDGCVVYDQPYLHWHLLEEDDDLLVVQVIRGKDLITELVIDQRQVMYVEAVPQEDNNVLFDLIGTGEGEPVSLINFLMSHGYEEESQDGHGWTH